MRFFDCFLSIEKAHIVTAENLAGFIQAPNSVDTPTDTENIYNEAVKHGIYYTVNNSYRELYLILGCGYLSVYTDDVMLDYLGPDYSSDTMVSDRIEGPPHKEITPAEAKALRKKSFMAYNLGNSGEFLVIKYADGSCIILALPE